MPIISLPLSIQLINGNVADAGQVMVDLNQISSNVNANAAKNGINNDITSMTALTSITSALTVTGWSINNSTITNGTISGTAITATNAALTTPTITGGTITGAALDATCTVPTAALGTATTEIASTLFVANTAFSTALPAISGGTTDQFVTNNGSVASWSALLKAGTMRFADSSDTTKRLAFGLSSITTGTTRTITIPDRSFTIGNVPISSRTSNTILGGSDSGTFIDITSGTFSQTFTAAATLGGGWNCIIRNSGTGDITLDPNGGELIDGLTSYIMYKGETRQIFCSGTAFTTIVLSPFYKVFTASGTFVKAPGYNNFGGIFWNGGASGDKDAVEADGGAGGGSFPFAIPATLFGASETITVGAGGVTVTTNSTGGNAGGATSIGAIINMPASGASSGSSIINVNTGGSTSNVYGFESSTIQNPAGDTVYGGAGPSSTQSTPSSSSIYGGAAGAGSFSGVAGVAGTSKFGGNGGAAGIGAASGTAGSAPGGGGGGCANTGTGSGPGGRGEVRIWGIA